LKENIRVTNFFIDIFINYECGVWLLINEKMMSIISPEMGNSEN